MKTAEQIVKAISHRIDQLDKFNEQLIVLQETKQQDLMHIYFENEARLNELVTLLEYINEERAKHDKQN